jgi:hypothetical protein
VYDFGFMDVTGDFDYTIGTYDYIEIAFRHSIARIGKADWYCDGDTFQTSGKHIFDNGKSGWYWIRRSDDSWGE